MLSSARLKEIVSEARPYIERQMDDAAVIAGFRDVVAAEGGDWSALKALIKAQIKDERDESGEGKHVRKILDKAEFSAGYADMLGWSNMNEQNFSAGTDYDTETGEITEPQAAPQPAQDDDAFAAVNARDGLADAIGVEPSSSTNSPETANETRMEDGHHVDESVARATAGDSPVGATEAYNPGGDHVNRSENTQALDRAGASAPAAPRVNPRCLKAQRGEQCKWAHGYASCSDCNNEWMRSRQGVAA